MEEPLSNSKEQSVHPNCLNQETLRSFGIDHVYQDSLHRSSDTILFLAKQKAGKVLILYGSKEYWPLFSGEEKEANSRCIKACSLNHENCSQLRRLFTHLNPVSHGSRRFSLGMGDRLGIATPGHIRAVRGLDVFPVLAQQSMRELSLTGRNYPGVLDDVAWAAFQEGYAGGFGADADHLKTKEQIENALQDGFTMITLDCSDHIDNRCFNMTREELEQCYSTLPADQRYGYERTYLGKRFAAGTDHIEFDRCTLMQCALVYTKTLEFITHIYFDVIEKNPQKADFEVSIDETTVPTTPEAHFFMASELKARKIRVDSMAPRFCGEFQKGIDYIGDTSQFEREYLIHTIIAEDFGYRISVHSGSDKFSVFPYVGRHSKLNVHVKTAGTSYLEAVRLIAARNPALYRRMHKFALERLDEAKKYYHISAKTENIPDIDTLRDGELAGLMNQNDARQVLHITYGLLLQEKGPGGKPVFRDEIYQTLNQYEDEYCAYLSRHMQRHLQKLGYFNDDKGE